MECQDTWDSPGKEKEKEESDWFDLPFLPNHRV